MIICSAEKRAKANGEKKYDKSPSFTVFMLEDLSGNTDATISCDFETRLKYYA